ncbi:MAG: hypothetical protein LBN39_01715 [Planctomycetaceae bacterium]|nr:hypothetical protein [Planctomycetaceae bacterium]
MKGEKSMPTLFRCCFIGLALAVFLTGCEENTAYPPPENVPPVPQDPDTDADALLDQKIADALKEIEQHAADRQQAVQPQQTAQPSAELPAQPDSDGLRKARSVLNAAQLLVLENRKEDALPLFQQADSLLTDSDKPFAAAMLALDISLAYSLLNETDKARDCCAKAEQFIQKIAGKTLQTAAKLRYAKVLLTIRTNDPKLTLAEQLANIKKAATEASQAVKTLPAVPELTIEEENPLMLPVPTRTEMLHLEKTLLGKVTEMFSAAGIEEPPPASGDAK